MSLREQIEAFRKNPQKVNRLAALIADPVFVEATGLALRCITPFVGKTPTHEALSIQQSYSAGYVRGIESYEVLSVLLQQAPSEVLAEPFAEYFDGTAHMTPQEIEEKVRKRKPRRSTNISDTGE